MELGAFAAHPRTLGIALDVALGLLLGRHLELVHGDQLITACCSGVKRSTGLDRK